LNNAVAVAWSKCYDFMIITFFLKLDKICIIASIFIIMFILIIPATVENPPIITAWISDSVRSVKYGLMIIGASDYIIIEEKLSLYYSIKILMHTIPIVYLY